MRNRHQPLLQKIKETRDLSDELRKELTQAIKEFKDGFVKTVR